MKRADVISTIQRSSEDETKFLEMMEKHVSAFGNMHAHVVTICRYGIINKQ